ncbi:MAG: ABC transporter substrate-binding protein [Candidatus Gracilibacteria bacterium]
MKYLNISLNVSLDIFNLPFSSSIGREKLLVVYDVIPKDIDPYTLNVQRRQITANIFDGLTQIDRLYRPKSALALSWGNINENTWEFKLRKQVKFHNGEELTTKNITSSFQRAKEKGDPELIGIIENIVSVDIVDDYTLRIKTKLPDPLLLTKLSFLSVTSEKKNPETGYYAGTGPYQMGQTSEGAANLERFDEYWGELPVHQQIALRALPDKFDRFTEVVKGNIDILAAVPASTENIAELKTSPTLDLLSLPSLELVYLMFHLDAKVAGAFNPLSEPVVRKAVSLALNQDDIVSFGEGFANPVNQYIASGIFGYNRELPKKIFSLAQAKEEFGDRRFTIKLFTTKDFKIIAEYLRVQLEPLGVNVEHTQLEEDEFMKKLEKKEMQSYILGWRFDFGDSLEFFKTHIHSTVGQYGQYNANNYKNLEVDKLIEDAEQELDDGIRLRILQNIQTILQRDSIGVPLFETEHLFVKKKTVQWEPRLDGLILFNEVY